MPKALDEILPLRQIHTLDEVGQARDAFLEAGGVERAGGGVSVDVRAVMEPCDLHTGFPSSLCRGNQITRLSVTIC